jgi:hypothetical protein
VVVVVLLRIYIITTKLASPQLVVYALKFVRGKSVAAERNSQELIIVQNKLSPYLFCQKEQG